MKRINDIIPDIDLQYSEYHPQNSRDYYKGTSFKMSGEWTVDTHYFNDDFIVSFVSFSGALLSCLQNHQSSEYNKPELIYDDQEKIVGIKPNEYWNFILAGTEGPIGKTGDIGKKGDKGDTPKISIVKDNNKYYWSVDGEILTDLITGNKIEAAGPQGIQGKPGQVYLPDIIGTDMVFTLTDTSVKNVKIDLSKFKGDPGKTPRFNITKDGTLTYHYTGESTVYTLGNIIGPRGKQGEQGERGVQGVKGDRGPAGPIHEFHIKFDAICGMSKLYCRIKDSTEKWKELGPVGGVPGKHPKLIRVWGGFGNRSRDRILWGYDGIPVSKWTTLCYLDELRGDENIWLGCDEPKALDGVTIDTNKIWYDPCDESLDKYTTRTFLYKCYLDVYESSGREDPPMTVQEFEKAFCNPLSFAGYEIKFVNSIEQLGEASRDKIGAIYIVPSKNAESNNIYTEYIVIEDPLTGSYVWEAWGTSSTLVNLEEYAKVEDVALALNDIVSTFEGIRDEIKESQQVKYEFNYQHPVNNVSNISLIGTDDTVTVLFTYKDDEYLFDNVICNYKNGVIACYNNHSIMLFDVNAETGIISISPLNRTNNTYLELDYVNNGSILTTDDITRLSESKAVILKHGDQSYLMPAGDTASVTEITFYSLIDSSTARKITIDTSTKKWLYTEEPIGIYGSYKKAGGKKSSEEFTTMLLNLIDENINYWNEDE